MMARPVRGHLTSRPQQEGKVEPERDPQQEELPDTTEGEVIEDYNPDKPKIEPDTQEQREVDPDAVYAKMEMPIDGTLHQRVMPWEMYMGILQVHKA